MERHPIRDHHQEPLRALLHAARHLAAFVAEEEWQHTNVRSTVRSTRVLIKLIEGWCIDHAVRTKHAALAGLRPDDCGDDAVLAALYRHLALDGPEAKPEEEKRTLVS